MAGVLGALRPYVKPCIAGSLISVTVADRYAYLTPIHGASMNPTFEGKTGEYALVERSSLQRHQFSRGDVVVFTSPRDHRSKVVKRLIGLPGDWIQVPETADIRQIPQGHCWVEGDNGSVSFDSRDYGPMDVWPHKEGPSPE